ncbi:hypothetical protein [Methylobacterium sp. A54F]
MGTLHTFPEWRRQASSQADVRARIEAAAEAALDTADQLIAILDRMDGDENREDGGDAEPSLGAPEDHASQIVWLRGSDRDLELPQQDPRP